MLRKYRDFMSEMLLENLINESIIYFTPKFRNILQKIDNDISTQLLSIEATDIKPDVTFIDMSEEEDGTITFSTMANIKRRLKESGDDNVARKLNNPDEEKNARQDLADQIKDVDYIGLYSKSRNPIKIGRLVNRVFPGRFTSKEVEEFTNLYKALGSKVLQKFEIVEGKDIAKWYKGANYKSGGGPLNNSCMRNSPEYTFEIYTKNPELCKMLILTEDDKLMSRALLWKPTSITLSNGEEFKLNEGAFFMDRIYSIDDATTAKVKIYSDKMGWIRKSDNNHYSYKGVTDGEKNYFLDMKVKLKDLDYSHFPYMDTFRTYNPYNKVLINDDDGTLGHYRLDRTDSGYNEIHDTIYSDYYDDDINRDQAVWSEYYDSWLYRDDSVYVDDDWFPNDSEEITYDNWSNEWIRSHYAKWCEDYDDYIHEDDAVEYIRQITDEGEFNVSNSYRHREDYRLIDTGELVNTEWFNAIGDNCGEDYIIDSILTKDDRGEIIPIIFEMTVYKVEFTINDKNYDMISEVDAIILDINIEDTSTAKVDKFRYNLKLQTILNEIYSRGQNMIKDLQKSLDSEPENETIPRKLTMLSDRLIEISSEFFAELVEEEDQEVHEGKTKFPNIKNVKWEGFDIKVGKDAKSNDYLTFEIADDEDIWMHTRGVPGSHVVIKVGDKLPGEDVIRYAAEMAKRNSKAKNSDNVEVVYCKRKFVKKGKDMNPGQVRVEYINADKIII